jgi:serine protease
MRRMGLRFSAMVATLVLPLAAHTPLAQVAAPVARVGNARVIVKYRADSALMKKQAMTATGVRILQATALGNRIGIALAPGSGITDRSHVVFATGISSKALAARIAAESDIEYAVPDERKHIVAAPNDPFYATRAYNSSTPPTSGGPLVGQWYLKPPGVANVGGVPTGVPTGTAPSSINAEQAWDLTTGSASIVIADIDTGIRFDHADLQGGNILPGYDMVSADSISTTCLNTPTCAAKYEFATAGDGDGRDSDARDPGDFVTSAQANDSNADNPLSGCTADPTSSWHGTQTAGLMGAATNNGVGIASVGFGTVKVLPVRALGRCGGYDSDIQAAMLWSAGLAVAGVPANPTPAKVLNMSLGASGTCNQAYQDIVNQVLATGAVIVVAAGNGDANGIGTVVGSPANCTGVVAVAALRSAGDKVGFSNLGPEVAIGAPGGNCVNTASNLPCLYPMMTLANSGATTPVVGAVGGIYTDSFNASLGTSFSTPLVSGTVALMLSVQPALTPAQVKTKLQESAQPFPATGGSAPAQTACVAPSAANSSEQGECYCVVGLCGAGMLDAHAAVLAALGVQAAISDSTAAPTAGLPVALTSTSTVGSGGAIASYAWAVTSAGSTGVTITSGQGASTLNLLPAAAGSFSVSLTVTDAFGNASTTTSTVAVAAAASPTVPSTGSSGGGAIGAGWLLLLLAAVLVLAAEDLIRRRRAALSDPLRSSSRRR